MDGKMNWQHMDAVYQHIPHTTSCIVVETDPEDTVAVFRHDRGVPESRFLKAGFDSIHEAMRWAEGYLQGWEEAFTHHGTCYDSTCVKHEEVEE